MRGALARVVRSEINYGGCSRDCITDPMYIQGNTGHVAVVGATPAPVDNCIKEPCTSAMFVLTDQLPQTN